MNQKGGDLLSGRSEACQGNGTKGSRRIQGKLWKERRAQLTQGKERREEKDDPDRL